MKDPTDPKTKTILQLSIVFAFAALCRIAQLSLEEVGKIDSLVQGEAASSYRSLNEKIKGFRIIGDQIGNKIIKNSLLNQPEKISSLLKNTFYEEDFLNSNKKTRVLGLTWVTNQKELKATNKYGQLLQLPKIDKESLEILRSPGKKWTFNVGRGEEGEDLGIGLSFLDEEDKNIGFLFCQIPFNVLTSPNSRNSIFRIIDRRRGLIFEANPREEKYESLDKEKGSFGILKGIFSFSNYQIVSYANFPKYGLVFLFKSREYPLAMNIVSNFYKESWVYLLLFGVCCQFISFKSKKYRQRILQNFGDKIEQQEEISKKQEILIEKQGRMIATFSTHKKLRDIRLEEENVIRVEREVKYKGFLLDPKNIDLMQEMSRISKDLLFCKVEFLDEDINDLVARAIRLVSIVAFQNEVSISYVPIALKKILMDSYFFTIFLASLLKISIERTPKNGRINILAELKKEEDGLTHLFLRIEDNGFSFNTSELLKLSKHKKESFEEDTLLNLSWEEITDIVKILGGTISFSALNHRKNQVVVDFLQDENPTKRAEQNFQNVVKFIKRPQ